MARRPPPLHYAFTVEWPAQDQGEHRQAAQEAAHLQLAQVIRQHQELEAELRGDLYRPGAPAWRPLIIERMRTIDWVGQVQLTLEAYPSFGLFSLATELGDLVWPEDPAVVEPGWAVLHLVRRGFEPVTVWRGADEVELWRRTRLTDPAP